MKVKSRLLLAVVAGLLAASTVGVAAQEESATFFEVTMVPSGPPSEPQPGDSGPDWQGEVGMADTDIAVDAADPRASGLLDQVRNSTGFQLSEGGVGIARSAVRLVNDQGSWVGDGTITSRNNQGPPTHLAAKWRLEGDDAYEGLILEFHSYGDRTENPSTVWGVIYPAEAVPPAPEPLADE